MSYLPHTQTRVSMMIYENIDTFITAYDANWVCLSDSIMVHSFEGTISNGFDYISHFNCVIAAVNQSEVALSMNCVLHALIFLIYVHFNQLFNELWF